MLHLVRGDVATGACRQLLECAQPHRAVHTAAVHCHQFRIQHHGRCAACTYQQRRFTEPSHILEQMTKHLELHATIGAAMMHRHLCRSSTRDEASPAMGSKPCECQGSRKCSTEMFVKCSAVAWHRRQRRRGPLPQASRPAPWKDAPPACVPMASSENHSRSSRDLAIRPSAPRRSIATSSAPSNTDCSEIASFHRNEISPQHSVDPAIVQSPSGRHSMRRVWKLVLAPQQEWDAHRHRRSSHGHGCQTHHETRRVEGRDGNNVRCARHTCGNGRGCGDVGRINDKFKSAVKASFPVTPAEAARSASPTSGKEPLRSSQLRLNTLTCDCDGARLLEHSSGAPAELGSQSGSIFARQAVSNVMVTLSTDFTSSVPLR